MNLWEKTIINLQQGYEKMTAFAAVFSERLKAEINIIRLRMQLDEVQEQIRDQHYIIGRKLLELRDGGSLPASLELFFKNDEIASALEKISSYEKDLENILDELRSEADALKAVPTRKDEEKAA
jgi:archaellum component FlaC